MKAILKKVKIFYEISENSRLVNLPNKVDKGSEKKEFTSSFSI